MRNGCDKIPGPAVRRRQRPTPDKLGSAATRLVVPDETLHQDGCHAIRTEHVHEAQCHDVHEQHAKAIPDVLLIDAHLVGED